LHVNPIVTDLFNTYRELVGKVARREHRGIRTIEAEDIEQQVWQVVAQKSKGTDFRQWDAYGFTNLVTKIAREYVARERIEYMHFAGAFVYNPAIVEVYLKDAVWANVEDVVDIDGRVDVKNAIATLPLETQRCLFVHYGMDQPYKYDSKEYKRVERAVETISDRLNMDSGVKIGDLADAA
jgi:hypothetical protein